MNDGILTLGTPALDSYRGPYVNMKIPLKAYKIIENVNTDEDAMASNG